MKQDALSDNFRLPNPIGKRYYVFNCQVFLKPLAKRLLALKRNNIKQVVCFKTKKFSSNENLLCCNLLHQADLLHPWSLFGIVAVTYYFRFLKQFQ